MILDESVKGVLDDDQDESVKEILDDNESVKEGVLKSKEEDKGQGKGKKGKGKTFFNSERKGEVKEKKQGCSIGVHLVHFLVESKFLKLYTDLNLTKLISINDQNFYAKSCYAMCNFDFSLLPIKLNLPMVCKPKDGSIKKEKYETVDQNRYISLSDIAGGYLKEYPTFVYNRFKVLTSHNTSFFNILLNREVNFLVFQLNWIWRSLLSLRLR